MFVIWQRAQFELICQFFSDFCVDLHGFSVWITLDLCACAHAWLSSLRSGPLCVGKCKWERERESAPDWFAARWRPWNHRQRQLRTFLFVRSISEICMCVTCVSHVYAVCMLCVGRVCTLCVYCVCTLFVCILCTWCNFCDSHLLLQLLLIRDVAGVAAFVTGDKQTGVRKGVAWRAKVRRGGGTTTIVWILCKQSRSVCVCVRFYNSRKELELRVCVNWQTIAGAGRGRLVGANDAVS